jgi:hypothetical protein
MFNRVNRHAYGVGNDHRKLIRTRAGQFWHRLASIDFYATALFFCIFAVRSSIVIADQPSEPSSQAETVTDVPAVEVSADEAAELIRSLAAPTFDQRERAMSRILSIGAGMAPYLKEAIETTDDPELALRAQKTLSQMTLDDFESRVEIFLSGKADSSEKARQWFAGWAEFEAAIGDSDVIRELFVSVLRAHPDSPKSLTTNTAERAAVAERIASSVQHGMLERRQPPTLTDGVAVLIPLIDPDVRLGGANELTLLSIFNRQYGDLRRNPLLWQPVSKLLEMWILRSRIENRTDVLWYSMQWEMPASGRLGLQTLEETTDVETLQAAFQAISRFRGREDAPQLARWLDDERPAMGRMPVDFEQKPVKVKVADMALATIAILYSVPLKDLGMRTAELHPKVGFLIDNAGYTDDQASQRAEAIQKAKDWCQGKAIPSRPRS